MLCSAPAFSVPLNVVVVVSDDSSAYTEIADYIASNLAQHGAGKARTVGADAFARLDRSGVDVMVAVGLKATQAMAAADMRVPVISTLIPKATFDRISAEHREKWKSRQFTAVYLDQPIGRQLDLLRLVLPDKKHVGVVLGPTTEKQLSPLQTETGSRGMQLHSARINSETELFPALQKLLSKTDVLFSVPDPMVYSAHTIQSVLITSYRFQVPVMGFSSAYVNAGALVAVHSTPAQLARQVAEILWRFSAGVSLPSPQYPVYFNVAVNRQVARSLHISVGDEKKLAAQLEGMGAAP